jgi:hypothetical protein
MSGNKDNANAHRSKPANAPSDYRTAKDAGFRGTYDFMLSYGLKAYELDDVKEAKAILQGFRDVDKYQASRGSASGHTKK